ncbi:MAG TPA: hypothetical protein DEA62_00315 [Coxiellaceae bacterium]|nr:hypothetical protein [Coxiellaceae bacterium]HBY55576.1 hypothetical protein [Coxiellaceae bacterium]
MCEIIEIHFGVNDGGLDVSVSENVGYLLKCSAFREHHGRKTMPQHVRAIGRIVRIALCAA